ncbi:MAG: DNA gyrase inhibitor YacG [Verrucomicrobia bacterium]|nr:DNA gyrase inhibitor YacG [Verrucomicrobiota bacterium]
MGDKKLQVRCPTCGKRGSWFDGPHGPFCSKRCRLIDLGRWLGEEYRISEPVGEAASQQGWHQEDQPPSAPDEAED